MCVPACVHLCVSECARALAYSSVYVHVSGQCLVSKYIVLSFTVSSCEMIIYTVFSSQVVLNMSSGCICYCFLFDNVMCAE